MEELPFGEWVAEAGRRAEQARSAAGRPLDRLLGAEDLPPLGWRQVPGEGVGVRPGVVLDPVAPADDLGREVRAGLHPPADAEEGGAGSGAVQEIEHPGGDLGVGAVVEGQAY